MQQALLGSGGKSGLQESLRERPGFKGALRYTDIQKMVGSDNGRT